MKKGTIVEQWIGISTDEAMRMKKATIAIGLTSRWPSDRNENVKSGLLTDGTSDIKKSILCQASPRA